MARTKRIKSPTQIELIEPVFTALRSLGGSANISEIRDKVIEMLQLTDEIVDEPHKGSASQQTELEYQLAWARTRLKAFGAITNSQRGVWMITPQFSDKDTVSKTDVVEFIKKQRLANKTPTEAKALAEDDDPTNDNVEIPEELEPWRTELAETLHLVFGLRLCRHQRKCRAVHGNHSALWRQGRQSQLRRDAHLLHAAAAVAVPGLLRHIGLRYGAGGPDHFSADPVCAWHASGQYGYGYPQGVCRRKRDHPAVSGL